MHIHTFTYLYFYTENCIFFWAIEVGGRKEKMSTLHSSALMKFYVYYSSKYL